MDACLACRRPIEGIRMLDPHGRGWAMCLDCAITAHTTTEEP